MKNKVRILSLILASALALLLPFTLSACSKEDDTPAEELPYTAEEVCSSRGELNIYGKLYTPQNAEGKLPAVILSHSANLNADSMNLYAVGFAERGFIAYAFDYCGSSSKSRSDGDTDDMTLFTEIEDLKAVISFVCAMDNVDENNIYLFGTSQGGLVSALTAEECAAEIKGEILLYPAFNIPELVKMAGSFGSLGGYGQAFSDTLADYDVYEHIGNFDGNVLIIHGSSDFIVNKSYSEQAAAKYKNCTLKIIDGANHGFNSENITSLFGNYDQTVWEYIDEYLNPSL
ncbi:MAG: alpha/beta hydrolase family protein [Candidatus Coproplasma sp.]